MIVSYLAGTCSPAEELDFEAHCFSCDECCSTLAIILLAHSPGSEEEGKASAALGEEAARISRQKQKALRPTMGDVPPLESPFPAWADGAAPAGDLAQFMTQTYSSNAAEPFQLDAP